MAFELPVLPYGKNRLVPYISEETLEYHYGKHHQTYVTNLNNLVPGTEFEGLSLEEIIMKSSGGIFNNAAQVWNHSFFWHSIKPHGGGKPTGEILSQIEKDFGSYEKFTADFKGAAVSQFGSGWAWLVYKSDKLHIIKTANAETPITEGYEPIIACDVWEHAYYIDYRNRRPDYVSSFIDHMINWEFASLHLKKAKKQI